MKVLLATMMAIVRLLDGPTRKCNSHVTYPTLWILDSSKTNQSLPRKRHPSLGGVKDNDFVLGAM